MIKPEHSNEQHYHQKDWVGAVEETVPGVAKVGDDSHSKQLEASLKEEDNGEDSIEVVKAVHQEGLRLKPGRK